MYAVCFLKNYYNNAFHFIFRYSQCEYFTNGTEAPLEHEVIVVTCFLVKTKKKVIYEDAYAIIKKIKVLNQDEKEKSWNILILGMDTMSRARIYKSMPKTAAYLSQNNWLDYRGYQKVTKYYRLPNIWYQPKIIATLQLFS